MGWHIVNPNPRHDELHSLRRNPPPDCCDGSGGSGSTTVSLSVTIAGVDTTDPNDPIVSVDVSAGSTTDPVSDVILEVNGTTVQYTAWQGDGRYECDLSAIGNYGEGDTPFDGKVCTSTGECTALINGGTLHVAFQ